jgi:hypothetical protein
MIGDSLTAGETFPDVTASLEPGKTFVGSKTTGAGTGHEGWGGYSAYNFVNTATNPFRQEGSFDIPYYLGTIGNPNIGWVVISLGINDVFPYDLSQVPQKASDAIVAINDMVVAFRASYPNARFVIGAPAMGSSSQAAWDASYAPPLNDIDLWLAKRAIMVDAMASYAWTCPHDGIYYLEYDVDRVTGYPANNALHPNTSGYTEMATQLAAVIV